jgi:hypothetical protein
VGRRLFESLAHRREHRVLVREFAGLQLRVEEFSVDTELETTASRRNELHVLNTLFVLIEELVRQTDGFRFVASLRAILEFHVHDSLLLKKRISAASNRW